MRRTDFRRRRCKNNCGRQCWCDHAWTVHCLKRPQGHERHCMTGFIKSAPMYKFKSRSAIFFRLAFDPNQISYVFAGFSWSRRKTTNTTTHLSSHPSINRPSDPPNKPHINWPTHLPTHLSNDTPTMASTQPPTHPPHTPRTCTDTCTDMHRHIPIHELTHRLTQRPTIEPTTLTIHPLNHPFTDPLTYTFSLIPTDTPINSTSTRRSTQIPTRRSGPINHRPNSSIYPRSIDPLTYRH